MIEQDHRIETQFIQAQADTLRAATRVLMDAALNLIEADPHTFGGRPCATCQAVSAIVGRRFGCVGYPHRLTPQPPPPEKGEIDADATD